MIWEWERANLVVRSSGFFNVCIYVVQVRMRGFVSHFFLSEMISKFLHIFTHTRCLAISAEPRGLKRVEISYAYCQKSI